MRREDWIDACRFFAIFVIMATHFLAMFRPEALTLWEEMPSRLVLGGLTGKFSVAFFFVLLGYFAGRPRKFTSGSFVRYTLRRYGQFSFFVFISALCYLVCSYGVTWLLHTPDENVFRVLSDGFRYNLVYLLRDAFLLEDNYNATLWCMRQLFAASILCWLLGCVPEKKARLAASAAVWALSPLLGKDWVWLGAGAAGCVLRCVREDETLYSGLNKSGITAALLIAALVCIKAPLAEGTALYSLQGLGAFLLILAQFSLSGVRQALASKPFPWLGRISMGLFVVHTPINCLLASSLWPMLAGLPQAAALLMTFLISTALSIAAAALLHEGYGVIQKKFKA